MNFEWEFVFKELFGDGLYWAGCAIIRLLGQQRRFEVLDYCYHLLRVNRAVGGHQQKADKEQSATGDAGEKRMVVIKAFYWNKPFLQPIANLIDRIRRLQAQNNQIYTLLGNYAEATEEQTIRHFAPPVYQPQQAQCGNGGTLEGSAL